MLTITLKGAELHATASAAGCSPQMLQMWQLQSKALSVGHSTASPCHSLCFSDQEGVLSRIVSMHRLFCLATRQIDSEEVPEFCSTQQGS